MGADASAATVTPDPPPPPGFTLEGDISGATPTVNAHSNDPPPPAGFTIEGEAPQSAPATQKVPTAAAPQPGGFLQNLRALDEKYTGGMGRQAVLAARAVPDAAIGLASMVPDAITSTYDYGKDLLNGRKVQAGDFNPFGPHGGYADPNLVSNQAGRALDTVLPHPENTPERIAHFGESFLAGAKMPVPGQIGTVEGPGSNPSVIKFNPATMPSGLRPGDTKAALAKLNARLTRDNTNFPQASTEVANANQQGVPLRLSDVGTNTRQTAEVLAQSPGAAATTITKDRAGIQADTKTRVPDAVRTALGADQGDAGLFGDALTQSRSARAKQNYEAVRNDITPVDDRTINELLKQPIIANLYQDARNSHMTQRGLEAAVGNEPPPIAQLYGPRIRNDAPEMPAYPPTVNPYKDRLGALMRSAGVGDKTDFNASNAAGQTLKVPENYSIPGTEYVRLPTQPDVRSLDYMLRAMNGRISQLYAEAKAPTSTSNPAAGGQAAALKSARDEIMSRLKGISPEYKKASETYGDDSEVMDAYARGKTTGAVDGDPGFLALSPGQATQYVNGLSDSGKSALRMGVADRLLSGAEMTGRNTNIAGDVLGGPRKQEIIRTLFDNDQSKYDTFIQALQYERTIHSNTNKILGGSPTYGRAAAAGDFQSDTPEKVGRVATVVSQLSHGWTGSAIHGIIHMLSAPRWNQGVASKVGQLLSSKDPQVTLQGLQQMEAQLSAPGKTARATMGTTQGSIAALANKYPDDSP